MAALGLKRQASKDKLEKTSLQGFFGKKFLMGGNVYGDPTPGRVGFFLCPQGEGKNKKAR